MSDANEAPKRRRLRFSLKTLLLLIAALSIWLGWNVYQVQQRQRMEQYINSLQSNAGNNRYIPITVVYGTPAKPWKSLPLMWRILGVQPVSEIRSRGGVVDKEDVEQIRKWFPEAEIRLAASSR